MMKTALFRFDDDLRSIVQHAQTGGEFEYRFNGPQSVKHLVESVGIPHTEIGAIRAGSQSVSGAYLVRDGDIIDVSGNVPDGGRAQEPRFVIDGHLGRLNSHLRMLGLDCLYQPGYADEELVRIGVGDERVILTRDRRLLMHKAVSLGYLVRSLEPEKQLRGVVERYGLRRWVRPFQRCIRCNHLLEPVSKAEIMDRLEPLTRLYFEDFRICPACRQIYWKGSHFDRMQRMIQRLEE